MEPQKAPHSNNDLDKEQSWKNHVSNIKLYCKAIVIKTTRVLVYKQTHRSMEQNIELRNKPTELQSIFDRGGKKHTID